MLSPVCFRTLLVLLFAFMLCAPAKAAVAGSLRVALLLETSLGDKDWNDALALGLERASKDLQVHVAILSASQPRDTLALEQLFRHAAREYDLVLVASDRLHEILRDNAANFRRTLFGCIDAGIRAPNIMSVTFADEQAAYLAGAAAAMLVRQQQTPGSGEQKILGWISGEDIPAERSLFHGFSEGALVIDPEVRVIQAITGSFNDAEAGRSEARNLLQQGAKVLVLACGMGNRPALEEVQKAGAYAVGLNVDHDRLLPGRILTSILKFPDRAVYDIVAATAAGKFKGKEILVRDLANGGVDITAMQPFKAAVGAKIAKNLDRRLQELRQEIVRGAIRLKSLRARTLCDCN